MVCAMKNNITIDHLEELIAFTNQRIDRYRAAARPIIFVQHEEEALIYGEPSWQLYPELHQEKVIDMFGTHANSFSNQSTIDFD